MRNYLHLLDKVLTHGERHRDRTGVGTRSLFGEQLKISLASFPLLTTKKVPFRWVAEELFWFLSGSTNVKDLQAKGVDIWDEWATQEQCARFDRDEGDLGPVYGALWRRFPIGAYDETDNLSGSADQIKMLVDGIVHSPNSRRLLVSGWHPHYQARVALPPCHTLWQVKVHEDSKEISMHLYARSIDIFLGLPFNIASYALLTYMIGCVTDLKPRVLTISFGDVHLYDNHIDQAKLQLTREPLVRPKLTLNKPHGDTAFDRLLNFRYEDLLLTGYKPHAKISAEVAV